MFEGVYVAIVTPFKNGSIDEEKLTELIEFQGNFFKRIICVNAFFFFNSIESLFDDEKISFYLSKL